ncbi:MAG: NnrS family protein, partial [Myxococcota bacterium]
LAVMTRVGLGHTGRPLVLPRGALGSYVLVHAGAAARVGAAHTPDPLQGPLLLVGGLLWAAAFGLFAILYASILTRSRIDGKDG